MEINSQLIADFKHTHTHTHLLSFAITIFDCKSKMSDACCCCRCRCLGWARFWEEDSVKSHHVWQIFYQTTIFVWNAWRVYVDQRWLLPSKTHAELKSNMLIHLRKERVCVFFFFLAILLKMDATHMNLNVVPFIPPVNWLRERN